jgi:hypothetical protein
VINTTGRTTEGSSYIKVLPFTHFDYLEEGLYWGKVKQRYEDQMIT